MVFIECVTIITLIAICVSIAASFRRDALDEKRREAMVATRRRARAIRQMDALYHMLAQVKARKVQTQTREIIKRLPR